jgi:hypothetical protein
VFGTVPHSAALVDICPSRVEIIQQQNDVRWARRGHVHDFLKCKITAFDFVRIPLSVRRDIRLCGRIPRLERRDRAPKAFMRIKDIRLLRRIVELVEELAGEDLN